MEKIYDLDDRFCNLGLDMGTPSRPGCVFRGCSGIREGSLDVRRSFHFLAGFRLIPAVEAQESRYISGFLLAVQSRTNRLSLDY